MTLRVTTLRRGWSCTTRSAGVTVTASRTRTLSATAVGIGPQGPQGIPGEAAAALTLQAAADLAVGQVCYVDAAGHLAPALASEDTGANALACVTGDCSAGHLAAAVRSGPVTRADWTAIGGGVSLVPGAVYYLSALAAGHIRSAPPTAAGAWVLPVGVATSPQTLDFRPGLPAKLN